MNSFHTNQVVSVLLTQHEAELGFGIGFFKFWLEDDHYAILQEIVKLQGI
jgi:hypothetical protein